MGTLFTLDDILLIPQVRVHSATVPKTFQQSEGENQETNEDSCQIDPHPEVGTSSSRSTQNAQLEEVSYRLFVLKQA